MVHWEKQDGGLILITFTEDLIGTISGNEEHFSVSWPEYDFVPDGTPVSKTGQVLATYKGSQDNQVVLEMVGTDRFNNVSAGVEESSGVIAHTEHGIQGSFLEDLVVHIAPVQSGSGDPSPDNVRPISGWTGAHVYAFGKNIADYTQAKPWKNNTTTLVEILDNGVHVASKTDGTYRSAVIEIPPLPAGTSWVLSADVVVHTGRAIITLRRTTDSIIIKSASGTASGHYETDPWVSTGVPVAISLFCTFSAIEAGDVDFTNIQLECADAESDYAPFSGNTYPVSWQSEAGTVYGGTLDAATGVLTVTHGNISSYNGETLPGAWISSMDVYTPGGTPTAGAQVVYELDDPITYQLTPVEAETLLGRNNIWADTGNTKAIFIVPQQITVAYDGAGTLQGFGSGVAPFNMSFTPMGLIAKPNQHPVEHIQIANATKVSTLTRIYYSGGYTAEHLSIASASWTGTLTHIDDL